MPSPDSKTLWSIATPAGVVICSLASGCAVVTLRVERGSTVLIQEAYPDRATAYERARVLKQQFD